MIVDQVGDDEELYRRVSSTLANRQTCYEIQAGRVIFKVAAFNDARKTPSVDRAMLRLFDPHRTRSVPNDGILVLRAGTIREHVFADVYDDKQKPISRHHADVFPGPIFLRFPAEFNCAHAVIRARPPMTSGSGFKRLKESLVRLANQNDRAWCIEPGSPLPVPNGLTFLREFFRYLFQRTIGSR